MTRFDKLVNNGLCLGCGLCESLGREKGYSLSLKNNGFYGLNLPHDRDAAFESSMASMCPSISMEGADSDRVWGDARSIVKAHSTDDKIRFQSSSGGFVTALCCYLLSSGRADGVLHVGVCEDDPARNKLGVSRTPEDVLQRSSSRYAPAMMFTEIKQILGDNPGQHFVFVGKSCDVLGLRSFINNFPQYADQIILTVAIFCAGMPSYKATEKLMALSGNQTAPVSIRYRGMGWPGSFSVDFADGGSFSHPYSDSWLKYLGPSLHYRCKICPDSVGTIADISVGDAWELEDGKTVFKEKPGESCVLVRTANAESLLDEMTAKGFIKVAPCPEAYLDAIQPNHLRKRTSSGYKIAAVRLAVPGLLRVEHLRLWRLGMKYNIIKGLRDMLGALERLKKWRKQ